MTQYPPSLFTALRMILGMLFLTALLSACGGSSGSSTASTSGSTGSSTSSTGGSTSSSGSSTSSSSGSSSSGASSSSSGGSGNSSSSGASSSTSSSGGSGNALPGNAAVTLPALDAAFAQLSHDDPTADASAMVAAAMALPDVATAGLSDPTTVYVVYKDGTAQVIDTLPLNDTENLVTDPTDDTARPQQLAERPEEGVLPTGRTVYIDNVVTDFDYSSLGITGAPTDNIRNFLFNQGYKINLNTGQPKDLMSIQGASVFYMETHGGFGVTSSGARVYDIATSVAVTKGGQVIYSNINMYSSLLLKNEMAYHSAAGMYTDAAGNKHWKLQHLLSFTSQFVRDYMSFSAGSIVFINGCNLMGSDPASQDMVNAFLEKNASVVLGWSDKVRALHAFDSGLYLFDRVLGAGANAAKASTGPGSNSYAAYPATPANRPFSVGAVLQEMHVLARQQSQQNAPFQTVDLDTSVYTGLTHNPTLFPITSKLLYKYNSAQMEGVALAPSISGVALSNNDSSLVISGDFGGSFQNRSVTIGGTAMPNAVWTDGSITFNSLPVSGNGSAGNILVTIDGAQSNHVLVNQWNNVQLTMTYSAGTNETRTDTCQVNLRTSFDTLRQTPDNPPITTLITTDNAVLPPQSNQCQFTDSMYGSGSVPWYSSAYLGKNTFPDTGTNAFSSWALSTPEGADGNGGGQIGLSWQFSYTGPYGGGPPLIFLDTTSTATGPQLTFDDSTQNLNAGSATQPLQWSQTAGLATDPGHAR